MTSHLTAHTLYTLQAQVLKPVTNESFGHSFSGPKFKKRLSFSAPNCKLVPVDIQARGPLTQWSQPTLKSLFLLHTSSKSVTSCLHRSPGHPVTHPATHTFTYPFSVHVASFPPIYAPFYPPTNQCVYLSISTPQTLS